jgi:fructokinase
MDVVCLGELLVDMFPAEQGRRLGQVSAFQPKPGGAPANVAVSLARLGVSSAFIGKVGDDAFGHHLAEVLAQEGVAIEGIRFDKNTRTTLAFIAMPNADHAEFLFYRNPGADTRLTAGELNHQMLSDGKIFHFGSLSLVEDPIRSAVYKAIEIVRAAGGLVSLDVNYRPTLWDNPGAAFKEVMAILPSVNLLKVNEDELFLLSGSSDIESGTKTLISYGPEVVIVTLGANGSTFRTKDGADYSAAFQVKTVDATGCGDAFIAGVLAQMIGSDDWRTQVSKANMQAALRFANAVGALTAQKLGVIPALPTLAEVQEFLSVN